MSGDVIFICGEGISDVIVNDEHDDAGFAHAESMAVKYHGEHGEWPSIDQRIPWIAEGREASRRRLAMKDYRAIEEAKALLTKHGYAVADKEGK